MRAGNASAVAIPGSSGSAVTTADTGIGPYTCGNASSPATVAS